VSATPSAAASVRVLQRPKTPGLVNVLPLPDEKVKKLVNPQGLPVQTGPMATVRGVVTVKGDQSPEQVDVLAKIPAKCSAARGVYGRLFREGLMRSVADALVTVTGYKGYVPAKGEAVHVVGRDCAWDRLTIGVMVGQRIEVTSRGSEAYMPELVGAPAKAMMIALPRGNPVNLHPIAPGRYSLVDRMHPAMTANVYALMFPTFDVTGLDGRYEISRVPPGEVTVMATLPPIGKDVKKTIKVEGGKTYDVNLELAFDADKDAPKREAKTDVR
jgi:hypothetical protein